MILAAGRGSRLRPLTDTIPKPLVTLANDPIIVHHIRRIAAAGFSSIVINLWHLGEQIESALGDGSQFGIPIFYSKEPHLLGTAGGISQAIHLGLLKQPFLTINSDIYCNVNLQTLKKINPAAAHLILTANPEHNPNGDFSLDEHRLQHRTKVCYTYTGIAVFNPLFFSSIPPTTTAELKPLLDKAIDKNKITATVHDGFWHDLGTLERLKKVEAQIANYAL